MMKKWLGFLLVGTLVIGSFLMTDSKEKAYAWSQGTDYKSISGYSTLYTGTTYPSSYDSSSDITFQADWTGYNSLTFQLQYYAPYGIGWVNSGSSWTTSSGHTWRNWTGLSGNYPYRVKIKNNNSDSESFSVLWLR
jgi:hypothetical protein